MTKPPRLYHLLQPVLRILSRSLLTLVRAAIKGHPVQRRAAPHPVPARPPAVPVVEAPLIDQRARLVELTSASLGLRKRLYVYTPPSYGDGIERLPVLYLFRGHEREWVNAREDTTRGGKTVIDIYEELLAAGKVGPMILVFPGIASDDNRWSGMLVNALRPKLPAVKGLLGSGRWEDYFLRELMPYIDIHYRTDTHARAVDGFSLGGFMAVKIAAQHPTLFCSVGAYDGLYFWDDPEDASRITTTDPVLNMLLFDPVWGKPTDRRYAAANNPLNLVRTGDPEVLGQLQWLIEYGPRSAEPNNSNFFRGDRLLQLLAEQGIPNTGGPITDGVHTWQQADDHMRRTLPLHWQRLRERMKDEENEHET